MLSFRLLAPCLVAMSFTLACGGKDDAAPGGSQAPALDPAAVAKANEIFVQRCTPCHGAGGHGDGSASATLNPKPRNFTDPAWQKSVTDDYITKIIKVGGAGVGKSPAMPSNPDLTSNQVLAALKNKIRSFGGK